MARIKTDKNISRKDVIVTKAATLFREKGFKAASMRDLAEAVGVEAASLYNHIKSKTELLHELCFSVANRFLQKIDAPTAVLIMLHAISGIESWHRSTQKISAAELEENMVTILVGGLTQ